MGIALTSYALNDARSSFPFVAIPDFEVRARKAIELSGSEGLTWSPFVSVADRQAWENYTVTEGPAWMRESMDASGMQGQDLLPFNPFIHNFGGSVPLDEPALSGDELLSGKFAPVW